MATLLDQAIKIALLVLALITTFSIALTAGVFKVFLDALTWYLREKAIRSFYDRKREYPPNVEQQWKTELDKRKIN